MVLYDSTILKLKPIYQSLLNRNYSINSFIVIIALQHCNNPNIAKRFEIRRPIERDAQRVNVDVNAQRNRIACTAALDLATQLVRFRFRFDYFRKCDCFFQAASTELAAARETINGAIESISASPSACTINFLFFSILNSKYLKIALRLWLFVFVIYDPTF